MWFCLNNGTPSESGLKQASLAARAEIQESRAEQTLADTLPTTARPMELAPNKRDLVVRQLREAAMPLPTL